MFLIDLKTLKTLIPRKACVFNVFNVFNWFKNIKNIKNIKNTRLQNPRLETCEFWIKNIKNINPPRGFCF